MKKTHCLKYTLLLAAIAALTTLSGCKDQVYPDIDKPDPSRPGINEIVKFDINLEQFAEYKVGDAIETVIDPETNSIQVSVPWYVKQLLRPSVEISSGATVAPISGSIQDFSQESVTYTVRAENGEKKIWKVYMTWIEEPEPDRNTDPRHALVETDKYHLIKFVTWGNTYSSGTGVSRSGNYSSGYITNTASPATTQVQTIYFVARHAGELQLALRGLTASSSTVAGNTINVKVFVNGVQAKDDDGVTDYNHSYFKKIATNQDTITLHRVILPEIPVGHVGHQIKIELRGENARAGNYYYRFYEVWTTGWATRNETGTVYNGKPCGINFSLSTPRDGIAAPSIHMNMAAPQGNMEYFYTEVTVPVGFDPLSCYYMTSGNGQGYAGIQTNSATDRRFLFSIWSAAEESDVSTLREKYNPKLVRVCNQVDYRSSITYAVFGGEGTGGQSRINVRWITGQTYKVLLRIRPHPDQARFPNSTLYKAWFHNGTEWMFMCEWRRQEIQPGDKGVTKAAGPYWYTSASHFVEDFAGTYGNVPHMAYYSNHWFITDKGTYVEPTGYSFTGNQAYGRADVAGGVVKTGEFANSIFLKTGGYFTDAEAVPSGFQKIAPAVKPELDLQALNAMGTDDADADKALTGLGTSPISAGEKYTE